jgi:hypothetical protein
MPPPLPVCPHCFVVIDPCPTRSRKCPHCRQPIVVRRGYLLTGAEAEEFEGRLAEEKQRITARKRLDRIKADRASVARLILQARESGVVSGMKPLVSSDACDVCARNRNRVFAIEDCTPEMLPPYPDCEFEGGCESTVVEVLSAEYGGPGRPARSLAVPREIRMARDIRSIQPGLIRSLLISVQRFFSKREE